ncbi:hypothetical protein MPER_12073 [Moniliophthora perniciosa FA553]|nr:hypothetical protein MPER_12073 [Moniliophthora perniciosa FA553]
MGTDLFFLQVVIRLPELVIQSSEPVASRAPHSDEHSINGTPPIYLFLHSVPMSVSELALWVDGQLYFWSFDKTGQSRMSEEECERRGLPVLTLVIRYPGYVWPRLWPIYVYNTLRDWQKARGFNPATSDWARHMGYPEWEIMGDSGRFDQGVDIKGQFAVGDS